MSDLIQSSPTPGGAFTLYQTENGRTKLQVRFQNETVWLTQKLLSELFQKDVRTINEHIQNIFDERELEADSVIRKFRITAADGKSYDSWCPGCAHRGVVECSAVRGQLDRYLTHT